MFSLNTKSVLSQNFGTIELKKVNNSVVFLREVRSKTVNQNGYNYIIGLKDSKTGIFYPCKTEFTGTGFTVLDEESIAYVVTVKHLAENLTDSSLIKFSGSRLDTLFMLKDVLFKTQTGRWYFSDDTDVAIGRIKSNFRPENDTITYQETKNTDDLLLYNPAKIKTHVYIGTESLKDTLVAPYRDKELLAVGYPSGIGNYINPHTTVSKFFRASSDIIDSDSSNPYFIIDDPSMDGLSGALTYEAPKIFQLNSSGTGFGVQHKLGAMVGMINGTFSDANGGKFTRVIPSKLILDELSKAKKDAYTNEIYHRNGNLWQEITIQDNKFIEVICNYNKNGVSQDKGSLKNGNGTIKYYDEEGKFSHEIKFKDGIIIKK